MEVGIFCEEGSCAAGVGTKALTSTKRRAPYKAHPERFLPRLSLSRLAHKLQRNPLIPPHPTMA